MNREFSRILASLETVGETLLERTWEGKRYIRKIVRQERLILLGAGHVAQALASCAAGLDFAITVIDDRPAFATRERFPDAREILCDAFPAAIRRARIRPGDYVCVLTYGHLSDTDCLRTVLAGNMPCYLGMIGSRRHASGVKEILQEEGFPLERIRQIRSPIGLPIQALTPGEIAISIAAEMIQTRRSRPREEGFLTQTEGSETLLRHAAESDGARVLLMVVERSGAAPVETGAMMLLEENGQTFGTVGGGSGEAAAIAAAGRLMGTGSSECLTLQLANDIRGNEGMVCGGSMKIWVEDIGDETD